MKFALTACALALIGACSTMPAHAQSQRDIQLAAATRAVSLCYGVRKGWSSDQMIRFSFAFLQKEGVSPRLAWGYPPQAVKDLADYMYTRLNSDCEFQGLGSGVEL